MRDGRGIGTRCPAPRRPASTVSTDGAGRRWLVVPGGHGARPLHPRRARMSCGRASRHPLATCRRRARRSRERSGGVLSGCDGPPRGVGEVQVIAGGAWDGRGVALWAAAPGLTREPEDVVQLTFGAQGGVPSGADGARLRPPHEEPPRRARVGAAGRSRPRSRCRRGSRGCSAGCGSAAPVGAPEARVRSGPATRAARGQGGGGGPPRGLHRAAPEGGERRPAAAGPGIPHLGHPRAVQADGHVQQRQAAVGRARRRRARRPRPRARRGGAATCARIRGARRPPHRARASIRSGVAASHVGTDRNKGANAAGTMVARCRPERKKSRVVDVVGEPDGSPGRFHAHGAREPPFTSGRDSLPQRLARVRANARPTDMRGPRAAAGHA